MVNRMGLYGAVLFLVALLVVSSSLAAVYYAKYQDQLALTKEYRDELNGALAGNNAALSGYNTTLSLLANVVANLNTSSLSYQRASSALATLWSRYLTLAQDRRSTYETSMLIDFGNGTRRWTNNTAVQPGWNAYVATLVLLDGKVQATWYPQYQEHFVESIDGVASGQSNSWFVWTFSQGTWKVSQTGADDVLVHNGTVFAWTLCGYDSGFNPACTP